MGKVKKALTKKYDLPFGLTESSLSMILGGLVVVLIIVMGANYFRSQHNEALKPQPTPVAKTNVIVINKPNNLQKPIEIKEEIRIGTASPTPVMTVTPVATVTKAPSPTPSKSPSPTPTKKPSPTPTKAPAVSPAPTPRGQVIGEGKMAVALPATHTVAQGESIWTIAEKYYGSGYNDWDIIQANKLKNPSLIEPGQKLIIPKVEPRQRTVASAMEQPTITDSNKITANKYTIVAGDNLWSIAVRAYGDGYRYVEIVKANKISDPNIINVGNVLIIPRK